MALDQDKERVHPVQEGPHIPVLGQREEALRLAQQPLLVIRREGSNHARRARQRRPSSEVMV
jgi:hypothetical protein